MLKKDAGVSLSIILFLFCISVNFAYSDILENFNDCSNMPTTISDNWQDTATSGFDLLMNTNPTYSNTCQNTWYGEDSNNAGECFSYDQNSDKLHVKWISLEECIYFIRLDSLTNFTDAQNYTFKVNCSTPNGDASGRIATYNSAGTRLSLENAFNKADCNSTVYTVNQDMVNVTNAYYVALSFLGTYGSWAYYTIDDFAINSSSGGVYTPYYNDIPEVVDENLKSSYCLNKTGSLYSFNFEINDTEGNDIYYYGTWEADEDLQTVMIEDFADDNFNMVSSGWYLSDNSCNYSTSNNGLNLYSGCDLDTIKLPISYDAIDYDFYLEFDGYVFLNTSYDICMENSNNQKLACLRMESFYDPLNYLYYTNMSYYNGSDYVFFDVDYYDYYGIRFYMNGSKATICINGEDLTYFFGCENSITRDMMGIADNNTKKMSIVPYYDYLWGGEFTYIDDISITPIETDITFINYGMSYLDLTVWNTFQEKGIYEYTLYLTDNVNQPNYEETTYLINIWGDCPTVPVNETATEVDFEQITDQSRYFLKNIDYGEYIFNRLFFVVLFLIFIFVLINTHSLAISSIIVGFIGLVASWILSGNYTQMISSATLIGFGITLLITGAF